MEINNYQVPTIFLAIQWKKGSSGIQIFLQLGWYFTHKTTVFKGLLKSSRMCLETFALKTNCVYNGCSPPAS